MLITVFINFWSKSQWEPCNKFNKFLSLGIFGFDINALTH